MKHTLDDTMYVRGGAHRGARFPAANANRKVDMRTRDDVIGSLEGVYREAFEKADGAGDQARMDALDFGFQRDQVLLEALLDVRDLLSRLREDGAPPEPSLLDKARAIRKFTRLGPR